ncbi:MAG: hypothetical protein V3U43_04465 [Pseudomonadales bacterium]
MPYLKGPVEEVVDTGDGTRRFRFRYEMYAVEIVIRADDELVLLAGGIVRKSRRPGVSGSAYVWTNLELYWEEHHFVEACFTRRGDVDHLKITMNGDPLFEREIERAG